MKMFRRAIILSLLAASSLLIKACAPINRGDGITPIETIPSEASLLKVFEEAPEIHNYQGNLSSEQIAKKLLTPQWETLWLIGRLVDQQKALVYYVNAWMGRDGRGSLVVSEAQDRLAELPDELAALRVAEEQLSDENQISRTGSANWLNVKNQWTYHPFEKSDRFMSLFLPSSLPSNVDWQIIGSSTVAGREALVLQGDAFRLWVDVEKGVILRLEMYSPEHQNAPLVSIQVEAIEYDPALPARTLQIAPQDGHEPSMVERPAGKLIETAGRSLSFHYLSLNASNPSAGYVIDLYLEHVFLGTLDLGSAGFYCDRASDWDHFAFIYQSQGKTTTELHWVDLRDIGNVNTIAIVQNPSAPSWSPNSIRLAVTGYRTDDVSPQLRTFVVSIPSGEVSDLGQGSLVPPAWTDDGKYIFGLDPTYVNLLMFDPNTGKQVNSWAFDPEQWQMVKSSTFINNAEVNEKLPRTGFDYLTKCAIP